MYLLLGRSKETPSLSLRCIEIAALVVNARDYAVCARRISGFMAALDIQAVETLTEFIEPIFVHRNFHAAVCTVAAAVD